MPLSSKEEGKLDVPFLVCFWLSSFVVVDVVVIIVLH